MDREIIVLGVIAVLLTIVVALVGLHIFDPVLRSPFSRWGGPTLPLPTSAPRRT